MFISQTNTIANTTPIVTAGVGSDLPSNMTSSDFSLNYTAASQILISRLGQQININYVAVSAINASEIGIYNGGSSFKTVSVQRNNVVMFIFEPRSFNDLRIRIVGNGSQNTTVNHVAAGTALQIPNGGEQSGYSRNHLTRNIKSRTVTSNLAAPVASLQQRSALKGTLNLPNVATSFVENQWQTLLDYLSAGDVFYITEQADESSESPGSSYACYAPIFSAPKTHASTRALNSLTLGFSSYNGL